MHPELRKKFNADFTAEKYAALVHCVNETERWPADFRISETPIFLTAEFTEDVQRAAYQIVNLLRTPAFNGHCGDAIPAGLEVPNESPHPNFLVIDFGICAENNGLVPRLIELQAFPSLYGFQLLMLDCLRKCYPVIPRNWTSSFGGIRDEQYLDLLRRTILAESAPSLQSVREMRNRSPRVRVDCNARISSGWRRDQARCY